MSTSLIGSFASHAAYDDYFDNVRFVAQSKAKPEAARPPKYIARAWEATINEAPKDGWTAHERSPTAWRINTANG